MAFLQSRNPGCYKTKLQTNKCVKLARFRSDPPHEVRVGVYEGHLYFADYCFVNILVSLISAILNARKKNLEK